MYDVLYKSAGILNYSGTNRLVLQIDRGIADFYRSLIPKYYPNNRPMHSAHVTVVRIGKEEPVHREFWGRYEGEEVPFLYSPIVQLDNTYFWLDVFSVRLEEVKKELGLPVASRYAIPPPGFIKTWHMTLANQKI